MWEKMFAQIWPHSFLGTLLIELFQASLKPPCTGYTSQQQASHLAEHVTVSRSAWNSMAQFVADNGKALTPDRIHL